MLITLQKIKYFVKKLFRKYLIQYLMKRIEICYNSLLLRIETK